MKVLDLFSGIGGFSIGLERAGFETVAFCEIEDYPRAVLRKHWPDTPIYRDIKQLTAEQLRADGIFPDVICGGYPCQPFSVAGKQLAEKDERHLWPEVFRLIRSIRPRWVICENVSGHIKLGFDEVATSLEDEGYAVWPFIIPACSVDAPHKRDRLYFVAYTNSDDRRDRSCTKSQDRQARLEHRGGGERQLVGGTSQDVADTEGFGLQGCAKGQVYGIADIPIKSRGSGTNFGDGWPVEPNVGRVVDGLPNRSHRIKALGNAVVPQIPEIIGQTIMRYEMEKTL
jgi:DNA (cytosine-5)-methyltransferase 1